MELKPYENHISKLEQIEQSKDSEIKNLKYVIKDLEKFIV